MQSTIEDTNHHIVPVLAGGGTRLPAHVGIITALKKLQINYQQETILNNGWIMSFKVRLLAI